MYAIRNLLVAVVVLAVVQVARADDTLSLTGRWAGDWSNSLGESGKSTLTLREDEDGGLTGTWDGVDVTGKRTNGNTIELQGKNEKRSYQLTATVKNGVIKMKYVVTRLDSDGSYDGKVTLTKQ
jgi:hypothetical protein